MLSGIPLGAQPDDTAEFLLGEVYVTVVLMESTGGIDPNLENWTPQSIAAVKQKVTEGIQWWSATLANYSSVHSLNFTFDFTYADNPVSTPYEPIARISDDFQVWINDFLGAVGFDSPQDYSADIRAFNHAQRIGHDADWAFTIFVVNDENDGDGEFAVGGTFSRAFAYAGGRFLVSPAGRPASTFAHESGHIFWARDEYDGGGSYTDRRGYYDAQNLNAANNPQPGFQQVPSIMNAGPGLDTAYATHTSSPSSLAMIGWRDSDGDGVFDVLDVPLTLSGSGMYDPATGMYHFQGSSSAATLPNLNSSGLQNDITINEVNLVEYRIDGGGWQTAGSFDSYSVPLDLSIPLPAGSEIELRTRSVDSGTGATVTASPIFTGLTTRATSTTVAGINGFVFQDANGDASRQFDEPGLAGAAVQLVDAGGQPLELQRRIEPDEVTSDFQLLGPINGIQLTATGTGVSDPLVIARERDAASTGVKVFGHFISGTEVSTEWTASTRKLRIDFASPVSSVSLDAVSNSDHDYGRLEIYDSTNRLLARYTTGPLAQGQFETMTLGSENADIKYAIARGHAGTAVRFDNLRVGPSILAVTDTLGAFSLRYLPAGTYHVQLAPGSGWTVTTPPSATYTVSVAAYQAVDQIDFGVLNPWQNPVNRYDVDNDGEVSPVDALIVINYLNAGGPTQLPTPGPGHAPPPFLDVSGDGNVAPADALHVINLLNRLLQQQQQQSGGEAAPAAASSAPANSIGGDSGPDPESEEQDTRAVTASAWGEAVAPAQQAYHTSAVRDPFKVSAVVSRGRTTPATDPQRVLPASRGRTTPDQRPLPSSPWLKPFDPLHRQESLEDLVQQLAADIAAAWIQRKGVV